MAANAQWRCLKMKQRVAAVEIADIVRRAQALVFDFDGTLVDSNPIKWHAFEACFTEFSEHRSEILAYCRGNHHIPRGEKFRHVYEQVLKLPYVSVVEAVLHGRFAAVTTRQIIEAPEILGAMRFLHVTAHSHETALLSSTPHDTLLQIVEERGWWGYFQTKRGAPVDKATWFQAFREERKLHKEEVIFFGDTPEDKVAARAAKCLFIAVGNKALALDGTLYIRDFTKLPSTIS